MENSIILNNVRNSNGFFRTDLYGSVVLSVQASATHYCSPRQTLDFLSDYAKVEVALFLDREAEHRLRVGPTFIRPSQLVGYEGPSDAELGLIYDDVCAYISVETLQRLEKGLQAWAAKGAQLNLDAKREVVEE